MKSLMSCIVGIALLFFSTMISAAFEDRIIAVVNDDVITLSELETALQPVMERIEQIPEEKRAKVMSQARTTIVKQMIERMIITQEAAKLKIDVTDKEVETIFESILEDKNLTTEQFREALAREGGTLKDYRDEIRRERLKRKLIDKTVKSKVSVGEEEIGAYYAKHRDEYEGKEANRLQQILIMKPKGAQSGDIEKLRAQSEEILHQITGGTSFTIMVGKHSQGPAAESGGDLGFVEKGLMFPAVDKAAFSLRKGEVSDVIESPIGFHIIKIIDCRGAGIKPIQEVREEIVGKIGNEKMKKKFAEWMDEVRAKSLIEIRL